METVTCTCNQAEIIERNFLLHSILDNTHMLMAYLDPELNFRFVNRAYAEADGRAVDFFPGRNHFALYPHPENEKIFRRVLRSGEPYYAYARPFEYAANPERSRSSWDWSLLPVRDGEGRIIGLMLTLVEVTPRIKIEQALRQSEERYRLLFENMSEGFFLAEIVCDTSNTPVDCRHLAVNPALEHLIGRKPEEMIGKTRSEAGMAPSRWIERLGRVALTGEPDYIEGLSSDFNRQYSMRVFSPQPDQFACIVRDITQRKQDEQALKEMAESLEKMVAKRTAKIRKQANRLRALSTQLTKVEQRERKRLATIVHDQIQQLIVAARMQIDSLVGDERIQPEIESAHAILTEALQESRSLTIELCPPVLYEAGLVGSLNWLIARMQQQHHFSVTLHPSDRVEPVSHETSILIFECVRELLFNAIKHSGVKEAEIACLFSAQALTVVVSDKGKGFLPEELEKEASAAASFGLFSIRERLKYLGGGMKIESALDRGTRVTLSVPLDNEEPAIPEEPAAAASGNVSASIRKNSVSEMCRVLIVDDHKIVREGLLRLFKTCPDIEVVGEAADGPEAIERAAQLAPDVILMDVNLGRMDGIEATKRILAQHSEIKVIGLSMHVDEEVADAMREAGAAGYLNKDIPSAELISSIRSFHAGKPNEQQDAEQSGLP